MLGSKGCWSSCMLELSMVVEAVVEGPQISLRLEGPGRGARLVSTAPAKKPVNYHPRGSFHF